tara:strand:- start:21 stop:176 length:156 start_codon:yes stop_codon:yes gene_type:complete
MAPRQHERPAARDELGAPKELDASREGGEHTIKVRRRVGATGVRLKKRIKF